MAKRVLVCGGRDFGDLTIRKEDPLWPLRLRQYRLVHKTLSDLFPSVEEDINTWLPPDGTCIISGKAKGADSAAADWAVVHWTQLEEYPADWKTYGKRAGYIRNVQMLEEGKPDLVLAFPGGKGTAMMIDLAKKAGIEVIEVLDG